MTYSTQLFVAAGIALAFVNGPTPAKTPTKAPKAAYAPVAVLELFTSQGCSSCPSADRLLTETLSEAAKTDKNIVGLSFHVDY